jgi:hypothetical protein
MGFEEEYQAYLNGHLQARTGERLRRLERVWPSPKEHQQMAIFRQPGTSKPAFD